MFNKETQENTKLKEDVWEKAAAIPGYDKNRYRQDAAGAWIEWSKYGDRTSELGFGWEIDHIKPRNKNGSDILSNLQPLQWVNNCSKGDNYPAWEYKVSSDGDKNIYKTSRENIK